MFHIYICIKCEMLLLHGFVFLYTYQTAQTSVWQKISCQTIQTSQTAHMKEATEILIPKHCELKIIFSKDFLGFLLQIIFKYKIILGLGL